MKKFLMSHEIHFGFLCKLDHQAVGQADDGGAGIAEAPVHTIMIRAVGLGDGDLSVPDRDGIAPAPGRGNGEFLVPGQGNGPHQPPVGVDLGMDGGICRQQQGQAGGDAQHKDQADEQDPVFCLHKASSLPGVIFHSISKKLIKHKKKFEISIDN